MPKTLLKDRCSVNTNIDSDVFVGIKSEEGNVQISFPLGFHISEEEKELRKDILLIMSTLAKNTNKRDSEVLGQSNSFDEVKFPIQSYLFIIQDFYVRGYYKEREIHYNVSKRGKINWSRTIKTQRAYIQDEDLFYLDFVTKRNQINENELITLIHKYCVYESFDKMGWLFSSYLPEKPRIKFKQKLFSGVLKDKLSNTFNDENRQLFINMLALIEYQGDENAEKNFRYGTYKFSTVWERMIDKVFGESNKEEYYPKTIWNLNGSDFEGHDAEDKDNAYLRPDTIMKYNDRIYVLDAKYYKYGWSKNPGHLPESTSINKQITYGEYIAEMEKFCDDNGNHPIVYNAFIMPYNSIGKSFYTENEMYFIGTARSNWKLNNKSYEKVQGILLDVKYLMSLSSAKDMNEITKMATLIDSVVR
ncbi:LlaJI family restriction endonuclease [Aminipila sp.]|uniref:LlaJI family restriction endonuclease n=1 Tax=Aminipila sp. TaxID=2060095 RepID=UPI00289D371F|nr:LlaJI family restriction endonuclease [Aminipila sp.]